MKSESKIQLKDKKHWKFMNLKEWGWPSSKLITGAKYVILESFSSTLGRFGIVGNAIAIYHRGVSMDILK